MRKVRVSFHPGKFLFSCGLVIVGGVIYGGPGAVLGFGLALMVTGRLEWR